MKGIRKKEGKRGRNEIILLWILTRNPKRIFTFLTLRGLGDNEKIYLVCSSDLSLPEAQKKWRKRWFLFAQIIHLRPQDFFSIYFGHYFFSFFFLFHYFHISLVCSSILVFTFPSPFPKKPIYSRIKW